MSEQEFVQGSHVGSFACPLCNSTDNLQVWVKEDEHGEDYYDGKCFTPNCKSYWSNNELVEQGVISGEFTVDKSKLKAPKKRPTQQEARELARELFKRTDAPVNYRGIRKDTFQFFGDRAEFDTNGNIKRIWYAETFNGEIQGFKPRTLPKVFGYPTIGFTGSQNDLSGQWKFPNGGRFVIIVGGENDRSAAFQMLRDYQIKKGQEDYDPIAVVSPTCGEGSAANQCRRHYDWFDKFDNIIVGMDNDEAGQAATEEIIKVLPKDKVKVATWSLKDPHKMLEDGKEKQFISNFWDAKPVVETGIHSSTESMEGVYDFLTAQKIKFPPMLEKLNEAARGGIRSTGAIVNIIADTSTGKTLFSDGLSLWWAYNSPLIPTTLSIERTKEEYMLDIISQHLGKNLSWFKDGMDAVDYLNNPEVKPLIDDLLVNEYGEPRFHVIDERNGGIEALKKQVDRSWKQFGSRLFLLDPLSDVLRSLGNEAQEDFMMWEKQMKKEGLVLVNILHTRKPMPDKEGKIRPVTEYDALGSSSFVQSADINIVLNRDKMSPDPVVRNTTRVDVPKLRGGTTGHICDLYYDPETRRQYDKDVHNREFADVPDLVIDNPPLNDDNEEVIF